VCNPQPAKTKQHLLPSLHQSQFIVHTTLNCTSRLKRTNRTYILHTQY